MEVFTMQNKAIIIKWITVAILALSLVLFLCPYITIDGESFNPIAMLKSINNNRSHLRDDAAFEVIFGFIVPVILTAVSALLMVFKISTARSIVCSVLNLLSVGVYLLFFNVTFLNITSDNIGFGFVGNIVVSCLGIVLPIAVIILNKIAKKGSIIET